MAKFDRFESLKDYLGRRQITQDFKFLAENLPADVTTQIQRYLDQHESENNFDIFKILIIYFNHANLPHLTTYLIRTEQNAIIQIGELIKLRKQNLLKIIPASTADIPDNQQMMLYMMARDFCNRHFKPDYSSISFEYSYLLITQHVINADDPQWPLQNLPLTKTSFDFSKIQAKNQQWTQAYSKAIQKTLLAYFAVISENLYFMPDYFQLDVTTNKKRHELIKKLIVPILNENIKNQQSAEIIKLHHQTLIETIRNFKFTDRNFIQGAMRYGYYVFETVVFVLLIIRLANNIYHAVRGFGITGWNKFTLYGTDSERRAAQVKFVLEDLDLDLEVTARL